MKREEQELLERARGKESWEEKPEIEVNEKDDGLKMNLTESSGSRYQTFIYFFKNLNSVFGLFDVGMG